MIELKKKLMNNPQHIKSILKRYNFHNVHDGNKEIRCGIDEEGNTTSIRIKLNEKLTANDFARDIHGDLFSMIMKCKNVELKHVIQTVKTELGISHIDFSRQKKIFGGFYENVRIRNNQNTELKKYDESVMKDYLNKYNTFFLKDGIDIVTQKKFKIGICHFHSRISVPWYDYSGELVGIEGRYMGDHVKDETPKWYPIIPFSKSQVLFGYHTNYQFLQGSEDIFIGESAKFTMQLDSLGIHTGLALGGNSIHNQQIKQLAWLNPKRIIFCYDEGLDEELIIKQVDKTKLLLKFFDIKVGYVSDKQNELMVKGSKVSPSDLGLNVFKKLTTEFVEWR